MLTASRPLSGLALVPTVRRYECRLAQSGSAQIWPPRDWAHDPVHWIFYGPAIAWAMKYLSWLTKIKHKLYSYKGNWLLPASATYWSGGWPANPIVICWHKCTVLRNNIRIPCPLLPQSSMPLWLLRRLWARLPSRYTTTTTSIWESHHTKPVYNQGNHAKP